MRLNKSPKRCACLVGTATIEASEELSYLLNQEGIAHNVLNAKQHEREADIIAQAGRPSCGDHCNQHGRPWYRYHFGGIGRPSLKHMKSSPMRCVVRNYSWQARHDEVLAAGGLHIIGSEAS